MRMLMPFIAMLAGCEPSETLVVQKAPAYLYSTVEACQWTARVGPDEPFHRPPRGIIQEIPVGAALLTLDADYGKDLACYKVKYAGKIGFVIGSCKRVDRIDNPCRPYQ